VGDAQQAPLALAVVEMRGEGTGAPADAAEETGGAGAAAGGRKGRGREKKRKAPPGEKPPKLRKRLMALYRREDIWRLRVGALCTIMVGVAQAFMGVSLTYSTFPFRDVFDPAELERVIITWSVVSIGLGLVIHGLGTGSKVLFAVAGEALTRRLRVLTLTQLLHQEIGYFDEDDNSAGALTEFLAAKINLVYATAQEGISGGLLMLSSLVAAIVISVVLGDWRILLIFTAAYFVGITILVVGQMMTGSQEARYQQDGAERDQESGEARTAGALVGEVVGAIRTVAALGMEKPLLRNYADSVAKERQRQVGWRMVVGSLAMGVGIGVAMAFFGVALWYGMWLLENDPDSFIGATTAGCPYPQFSIGRLMMSLLAITGFMLGLGANATATADAAAAGKATEALFKRIDRVSRRDPFSSEGERPKLLEGAIEVQAIHFSYPTRPDFVVCKGYSLTIQAGQVCALAGPSGSGKSTLVALLQRFYDPSDGEILLDGLSLTRYNLAWLRSRLGLVSQEPVLFQGSVRENIAHGKQGATQEEIEEAARQANALDFIRSDLSDGFDTQVGSGGGKLSGGQKQRVAIARALVRQPSVLLLDEATSALDSKSEKVVQAALDEVTARQRRTTVVIAHRLSTIRNADQIAVIVKGTVVESGTHDELRASPQSVYAELLAAQAP